MKRLALYLAVLFLPPGVSGQSILVPDMEAEIIPPEKEYKSKYLDKLQTWDLLYIDGGRYLISRSPIAVLNGYKDIFKGLEDRYSVGRKMLFATPEMGPGVEDKNYLIGWKIADGALYQNDISFPMILGYEREEIKRLFPAHEQYRALEKLTGMKFTRESRAAQVPPAAPFGVIRAAWVNGVFLIKKYPDREEWPDVKKWDEAHAVYRITIRNGKIVSKTEITL